MNKEEIEICIGKKSEKTYNKIQEMAKEIVRLQEELDKLKEVDRQICCEELITKDKYQDILKENKEAYHKGFIDGITSSKYIIGNKKEELEEKDKMFKLDLPEDATIYQFTIEILEELLEMIK